MVSTLAKGLGGNINPVVRRADMVGTIDLVGERQ